MKLPPKLKEVIMLYYWQEMSVQEIAQSLEVRSQRCSIDSGVQGKSFAMCRRGGIPVKERSDKQIIQQVFQSSLSGIQDDPWMAQRVLDKAHETGGFVAKKKISLAMVLLIVSLFLSFTVALAAIMSNTAQRFGELYGEEWKDEALSGDVDTSNPSVQIGDVIYAMDDVIVTGLELEGGLTACLSPSRVRKAIL